MARRDACTILAAAPTPARAARLTRTKLRRLLTKAGNQIRDLLKDFYHAALAAFAGLPEGGLRSTRWL